MPTIGAFAKACRLSPKALRLYDELDLLRPARVEAETSVRRDLAAFPVEHLTEEPRRDTTMNTLELRHHAHSDRGRVRPANQDTAHAGGRLLAVAGGFAPASGAAVEALRFLDTREAPAGGVLDLLEDAVQGAAQAVRDAADGTEEAGTTLITAANEAGGPDDVSCGVADVVERAA